MLHLLVLILGLAFIDQSVGLTKPTSVKLINNGYTGVVFAIHEDEPESEELIEALKTMITDASAYLYEATKHRAYFEEVMILIPDSWEDKPEYQSPKNATFEGADVIVAATNPRFAPTDSPIPRPHTKHYEGCGKRAVHIHLTEDFLLNQDTEMYYGNRGRVLVHEWAHYRWGLFNEYPDPIGDPDFHKHYYYSDTNKTWEPTRCTRGYAHSPVWFDSSRERYRDCSGDELFGYQEECVSFPAQEQPEHITASIMAGHTRLEQVVDFCDEDHNEEAPNKHNRLCGERSNWAVMREHEDFQGNSARAVDDTTPTFVLARSKGQKRVVLVLDSSGSMSTANRIGKLASATQDFLLSIAVEGSYIGIVDFDTLARDLTNGLALIGSEDTRENLARSIPTTAGGSTCIGYGLEVALEILTEGDQSPDGGLILLMTDGEDLCESVTAAASQRLVEESVVVDTVTISQDADKRLAELSSSTGGRAYHQSDCDCSTGLRDAFVDSMVSGVKVQDRRVEIHRESSTFELGEVREYGVFIDETVGNKTTFEFSYYVVSPNPVLEVTITSPGEVTYRSDYSGYTEDTQFKSISVRFEAAEPGLWTFKVENLHSTAHDVFSNVYTYPSQEGVHPIVARSELSGSTTDFAKGESLIAFTEIVQGFYPVIRAKVTAIIERPPDALGKRYRPVEIELLDNGAGADITKDDGIYSRYFTNFTGIGFYGVKINIESTEETVILNGATSSPYSHALAFFDPDKLLAGDIPTIGGEAILLPGMPVPELQGSPAPNFTRGISGGSSQVEETPENWEPGDDITPPSKIIDLRVTSSSYDNGTVTLEFTAPGNDLDSGNASYYVILMSESPFELRGNYSDVPPINESTILFGDTSSPGLFGDHQRFIVSVPVPNNEPVVSYTFALYAVDEAGNEGGLSNLAQAILREYIPPAITESPPKTTGATTEPSPPPTTTGAPTEPPPASTTEAPTEPLPPTTTGATTEPSPTTTGATTEPSPTTTTTGAPTEPLTTPGAPTEPPPSTTGAPTEPLTTPGAPTEPPPPSTTVAPTEPPPPTTTVGPTEPPLTTTGEPANEPLQMLWLLAALGGSGATAVGLLLIIVLCRCFSVKGNDLVV